MRVNIFRKMLEQNDLRAGALFGRTPDVRQLAWTKGDVVRKLRKLKGYPTMQALAAAADADVTAVGRLERGGNSDARTVAKVARALGISVAALEAAVPVTVPPQLRAVVDEFWVLTPGQQAAFLDLMEQAIEQAKHADGAAVQ